MRSLLCLFILAALAAAQEPPPGPPPEGPDQDDPRHSVTFQVSSRLVVVNVGVRDKSGKAIENLKASDFTVIEDGKPQKISVFEFQRIEGDAAPAPHPTS